MKLTFKYLSVENYVEKTYKILLFFGLTDKVFYLLIILKKRFLFKYIFKLIISKLYLLKYIFKNFF